MLDASVNFTAVADVMQKNPTELQIEFVEYPIIANTEFILWAALQSLVREATQSQAHFIDLALHSTPNADRQFIK